MREREKKSAQEYGCALAPAFLQKIREPAAKKNFLKNATEQKTESRPAERITPDEKLTVIKRFQQRILNQMKFQQQPEHETIDEPDHRQKRKGAEDVMAPDESPRPTMQRPKADALKDDQGRAHRFHAMDKGLQLPLWIDKQP